METDRTAIRERFAPLFDLARRQGFLFFFQANEHLPDEVEPAVVHQLLLLFEEEGVELVEDDDERAPLLDEAVWLKARDPKRMRGLVARGTSDRKRRLLGVARCRRLWSFFQDVRSRHAVEVAERLAEGAATEVEVLRAREDAEASLRELREQDTLSFSKEFSFLSAPHRAAIHILHRDAATVVYCGCDVAWCLDFMGNPAATALLATETEDEVFLLRDLFGNPFRPVAVEAAWLTPAVRSLARAAYEDRLLPSGHLDLGRLAVLADALEEAGCTDAELLAHLRGPGPHWRGCYPLDAVLGKS